MPGLCPSSCCGEDGERLVTKVGTAEVVETADTVLAPPALAAPGEAY